MLDSVKFYAMVLARVLTLLVACSLWGQDAKPHVIMGLQNPPPVSFPASDLPSDAMQTKATTACTECHEVRIIVQQRLSKAAWTKEVDKMIKWGALVDAGDHDALIDYLSKYFSPDQPQYEAPRSAEAQVAAKKKAK
jgi:hypothetical protein